MRLSFGRKTAIVVFERAYSRSTAVERKKRSAHQAFDLSSNAGSVAPSQSSNKQTDESQTQETQPARRRGQPERTAPLCAPVARCSATRG